MTVARPVVPLLGAASPQDWLAEHLLAHQSAYDDPEVPVTGRWIGMGTLLDDGGQLLREQHARIVADDGATPAAAAKWLATWFAGGLADAVGFVLAAASAALLAEADRVRFRLHPDGWPDRVDPGPVPVAVPAGHPWAELAEVRVLADDVELAEAAVAALTWAAEPVVEACRGLARVGRNALWAEVADSFGLPLLHQLDLPVEPAVVDRLRRAVRAPGRPWRKVPELRVADLGAGPLYLGRKGGCCLAYQSDVPDPDPDELTARERAYRERFPERPGQPRYCSTCSLRDLAGCEQRQVFWHEQERAERASG